MNRGVHISRESGYTQAEIIALIRGEISGLEAEIIEVESGTPTATSGTISSSAYIKRSGKTVVLDYAATGVNIPTSLTKIGTVPAKFAPSETVFGIGLIGFGAATPTCYAEVTTAGDVRIRGNTAQSGVSFRTHLVWIQ